MNNEKLSLIGHLTALRRALIQAFLSLAVGTILCLFFSKEIFHFLEKPLLDVLPAGSHFIATTPLEAVVTYLKVGFLAGIFLSSPMIMYSLWQFIAPGLYKNERKLSVVFVTLSTFFFVAGGLFGYFVIFPVGFEFFVKILEGSDVLLLPRMEDYLGFISKMLLTFGAIFELPIILILLARVGIIRYEMLAKARRYVLVLMFLVAGVLTPGPDVLSQFLLAVPLLILYELSAVAVWVMQRRKST